MGILKRLVVTRLPAEAAQALRLDAGVSAWSPLVGGGVAAATVAGLHVHTPQGRILDREWSPVRRVKDALRDEAGAGFDTVRDADPA